MLLARARGVDLRQVGSGNIGATNVGRALGKRWAVLVLLVDAAKGCCAGAGGAGAGAGALGRGGRRGGGRRRAQLQHLPARRGGKGVATSLGAALAISPLPARMRLRALCLHLCGCSASRRSGSLVGDRLVSRGRCGCWARVTRPTWPSPLAAAIVVLVRHRENLRRLVRGQELKSPYECARIISALHRPNRPLDPRARRVWPGRARDVK